MTPEEIEAVRIAEAEKLAQEIADSPLTKLQEQLKKAEEDRDNYKAVALKRLGKLPGDAEFLNKDGDEELSVAEQVRLALLDKEVEKVREAEKVENARLVKENAELRLAVKNRPGTGTGGSNGSTGDVKDSVFSQSQIDTLTARAKKLNMDPEKYIASAKEKLSRNH